MKKFWISFIALLMGVVIGVGIWHGIAYKDKLESFAKDSWDKIKSVFVKKDNNQPTEEQINLDGLYYLVVDGDTAFVQIKDSKYGIINGYIQDSKIYLASDWESEIELEPFHITEDDKYLHVFVTDQENGKEYKIAIYDKAIKKLYYDFSNGKQFPGENYEDKLLFEMIKFENFELHEHSFDEIVYSCPPSCNAAGREIRKCLCKKTEMIEISPALGHDYVNGVCTRCQEHDPNYVEACEHDWVEDLSYVPTAPSCGEYWDTQYKCSKCNETKLEKNGPLPHDYVNGVCSRCGESETTITTPEIAINDNTLIISNFDGNGTVNLYYRELGTDAWSSYVAGPVDEFDLTILLSRDWQPMERGKTYEIYVTFSNGNQVSSDSNIVEYAPECEHNFEKITCSTTCVSDGTEVEECSICGVKRYNSISAYGHNYVNGVCSRCGEGDPNSFSEITLSINSSTSEDFWLLFDVSSVKEYLLSEDSGNTSGFVFEVFLENSTTHESNKILTQTISLSDFNIRFGVDKMFASNFSQGNYNLSIVISSSTNFKIDNIFPVSFNHDGSHYLLTLSA